MTGYHAVMGCPGHIPRYGTLTDAHERKVTGHGYFLGVALPERPTVFPAPDDAYPLGALCLLCGKPIILDGWRSAWRLTPGTQGTPGQ